MLGGEVNPSVNEWQGKKGRGIATGLSSPVNNVAQLRSVGVDTSISGRGRLASRQLRPQFDSSGDLGTLQFSRGPIGLTPVKSSMVELCKFSGASTLTLYTYR